MSEIAFHGAGILVRYLTFVKQGPQRDLARPLDAHLAWRGAHWESDLAAARAAGRAMAEKV